MAKTYIDGRMIVNGNDSHTDVDNRRWLNSLLTYATTAEAIAGTATNLVITPATLTAALGSIGDLDSVLTNGNITGANDIEISNGQVIKAVSGDSTLNLRDGADDVFQITNSVVSLDGNTEAIRLASTVPTSATFMSKSGVGTYSTTGTVPTVMPIQVVSNAGTTTSANSKSNAVYINTGGDGNSTYNVGITNSVILGGSGITAKTSGIAYANQLGLNASGSAFEGLLDTATLTADRTYELPNASGIVNLTRYVAVNTPTVHTAVTGEVIAVTTGGVALVVNLPSAVIANQVITIKKVDAGVGTVDVTPAGAETIDGALSKSLSSQWNSITVISNGSNWLIIAGI